jgi:hypothetical protein
VIVWENAFATAKFPQDLFLGPYDERWSAVGSGMRRTHLGASVAEFQKLWAPSGYFNSVFVSVLDIYGQMQVYSCRYLHPFVDIYSTSIIQAHSR